MDSQFEVETRARVLGEALALLEGSLDWERLGTLYCSEGGEDFFCAEQREALAEGGLRFAQDLGERLTPGSGGGASLYLGAAIFELYPALFEHLVLEREVVLLNLDQDETHELNRGLQEVGRGIERSMPCLLTCDLSELQGRRFDHLWMTSVLNDPEAFPALHDVLYERESGEYATGRGDLAEDRRRAQCLLEQLFALGADECWLSTTDEELPLILEFCRLQAFELEIPDRARLSAIVGDPVRHCRLRRGAL
jgi:hypothetical protein